MRFKLLAEGSVRWWWGLGGLRCTGLVKRLPGISCAYPAVSVVRLMYQIRASRARGREETDNKKTGRDRGGGAQVPGRMSASHIHYSAPYHPPPSSHVVVVVLCRGGIIRSAEALSVRSPSRLSLHIILFLCRHPLVRVAGSGPVIPTF